MCYKQKRKVVSLNLAHPVIMPLIMHAPTVTIRFFCRSNYISFAANVYRVNLIIKRNVINCIGPLSLEFYHQRRHAKKKLPILEL